MKKNKTSPPKFAKWILSRLSSYEKNFALSHVMDEDYAEIRSKHGNLKSWLWCWSFVLEIVFQYFKLTLLGSPGMLKNYLRMSFRTIFRHKVFSMINVFGFAFGMTCFILIFLYVRYEMSFEFFFENADRIYRVISRTPGDMYMGSDYYGVSPTPLASTLSVEVPEIETATKIGFPQNIWLGEKKQGFYVRAVHADEEFLKVFSFKLIEGDRATALDGPNKVLVSQEIAEKYFRGENPVGKTVLNNFIVTGIFESLPENSHFQFDCVVSFVNLFPVNEREETLADWDNTSFFTYVKLRKGSDPQRIGEKVGMIIKKYDEESKDKMVFLQPLSKIHLNSRINFEFSQTTDMRYIFLFASIALLILIIATINYMNLSTARASLRAKEIGVRKVVGAQRTQLVRQFMTESIMISALAMCLALFFAWKLLPAFSSFIERDIQIGAQFEWKMLVELAAVVLLTGLAAGFYPAMFLSSFRPVSIIKGATARLAGKGRLRRALVVFQFCMTVILIVSCLVVYQQMRYLRTKNLGFNRENVIIFRITDRGVRKNLPAFKNELKNNADIIGITTSSDYPTRIGSGFTGTYQDEAGAEVSFHTHWFSVNYDFLDLYEAEIVHGRNFSKAFGTDDQEAVIVNETFVKQVNWKNPIGKKISTHFKKEATVVGVIKDFNYHSLRLDIKPLVINCDPGDVNYASVRIRGQNIPETIARVKNNYDKFMTKYPFEFRFLDDIYNQMYRGELKLGILFGLFSIIAVSIACLGLFGMASHACERRAKEIGIRKVLGASISDILSILMGEFARLIVVANLIAWPIAYFVMSKWLNGFVYRTGIGVGIFLLSGTATLLIAALTVSFHSVRTANANPSLSLRYE
jgi:putative ABC transport system permease protein